MLSIAPQEIDAGTNTCPFIEKSSLSVRWDGVVSPCLALLHTHVSYLDNHVRASQAFALGSLPERALVELWHDPTYTALRERLLQFDFLPAFTAIAAKWPTRIRKIGSEILHPLTAGVCGHKDLFSVLKSFVIFALDYDLSI